MANQGMPGNITQSEIDLCSGHCSDLCPGHSPLKPTSTDPCSTYTPLLSDSISLGGPWLHAFNTHLVLCDPSMSFVQNILNCINLSIILSPILCLVKGQRSWMITQKHFNWEFILYKRNGTQEKTFKRLHKSTVTEGHACMLKRLFQCWLFYSSVKRTEFYAPWCVVSSCISR